MRPVYRFQRERLRRAVPIHGKRGQTVCDQAAAAALRPDTQTPARALLRRAAPEALAAAGTERLFAFATATANVWLCEHTVRVGRQWSGVIIYVRRMPGGAPPVLVRRSRVCEGIAVIDIYLLPFLPKDCTQRDVREGRWMNGWMGKLLDEPIVVLRLLFITV